MERSKAWRLIPGHVDWETNQMGFLLRELECRAIDD